MNSRYFTLLISLALTAGIHAQRSKYAASPWKTGLSISPDICYLTKIKYKHVPTVPKFGYHTGISVMYKTDGKLTYEGGLGFSSMGWRTTFGPAENNHPGQMRIIWIYRYAELPLRVNYITGKNNLQFIVSASVIPAMSIGGGRIYDFTEVPDERDTGYDIGGFQLFAALGAGCCYQFNNTLSLRITPEFKIDLLKQYGNSHLWSAGLNTTLFYSL